MAKRKKCSTCKYSCRISYEGGDRFCQYILITGHRRPCPGGNECTVYEKGKRHREHIELEEECGEFNES